MPTSRTRLAAEAWGSVLRAHAALVPVMDRRVRAEGGIPLSWYDVMLELSYAPDRRLTMSELAERAVLSRTRISRLVDELIDVGYVARDAHPDDRRSAYAVLTDKGAQRFAAVAPFYRAAINEEFAAELTNDELVVIRDALGRLAATSSARQ
jgi:DNA-binding MarR family transcriptional regulator